MQAQRIKHGKAQELASVSPSSAVDECERNELRTCVLVWELDRGLCRNTVATDSGPNQISVAEIGATANLCC